MCEIITDVTPPTLTCPANIHRQHYYEDSDMVELFYPDDLITAWDYGGISQVIYDPMPGTRIQVLKEYNISAKVVDFAGNEASCHFTYVAGSK